MTTSQLSIAICDDDPAALVLMRELVRVTLRFLEVELDSCKVETAESPIKAEELASSGSFDLLITDLMWPIAGPTEWRQGLTIAETAKAANARTVVVVVTSKTDQEQDFRDASRQRGADMALTWNEAFGPGKISVAKDLAKRLAPSTASSVPQVVSIERATIGLVGLDTVAFSEEDDAVQEAVVKSFLGYMSDAWTRVARDRMRVRPIFVFTGDGVFLGLVGDAGPRLALDVGVTAWQQFTKLARYKTRIAIHSGPVNIATLSSGVQQLLGHSVNWLFRAVNAAPDDGLVVTDEYLTSVLQGGREMPPGLGFQRREAEAKHARALIVYDVRRT